MSPSGIPGRSVSSPRRRTVRIVTRRMPSRAATISLVVAVAAAVFLFVAWRIWQRDESVAVYVRTMRDVELDWRCEGGHFFQSQGQVEPRPCWMCGQTAFPVTDYECPVHDVYEVAVRFTEDADGVATPVQWRLPDGHWVDAEEGLQCWRCGKDLVRLSNDPAALLNRSMQQKDRR